jgi:hypothetical protein
MARTVKLLKNDEDPVGAPDFTLPVSIIAQVIPQLDVNISAQSIPTLNINIASISQGITVTTTVSNMPSTFPLPSDQLSQLQQITIANIAAGLVFNVNVSHIDAVLNINNWPSTYPLPSDQISTLQQITIQNVAAGLFIPIDIKQVTAELNISNFPSSYPLPDSQVSTLQQITIQNVAAGLYIPINIAKADAVVNSNATISGVVAGVYVPITIHSVESGVIFDINISSISSGVTFNVNISGTPTINVQTSGGANIVIDKLTQNAYTERQSTLSNNGTTPIMVADTLTYKRGKFFPRGCRGLIRTIEIYCDNYDTTAHTFTIKFAPIPGMGPIETLALSVPGNSSPSWRSVNVFRFWNYDSLFVWVSSDSNSYGRLAFDTGVPCDYYVSTNEATWNFDMLRLWVRVNMAGATVGDLPVSGTVNVVDVPHATVSSSGQASAINPGETATLLNISGPGRNLHLLCAGTYKDLQFRIIVDGVYLRFAIVDYISAYRLWAHGYTSSTPAMSLTQYDSTEGSQNSFVITMPFEWTRSLVVTVYNPGTMTHVAWSSINYAKVV